MIKLLIAIMVGIIVGVTIYATGTTLEIQDQLTFDAKRQNPNIPISHIQGPNTDNTRAIEATSWIGYEIQYTDGTVQKSLPRTENIFSSFPLILTNNERQIIEATFTVYTDLSNIGSDYIVDTPRITIEQLVIVNNKQIKNIPKQIFQINKLDENHILEGTGVRITPAFFERIVQDIRFGNIELSSGDTIEYILNINGRYEVILGEFDPVSGCISAEGKVGCINDNIQNSGIGQAWDGVIKDLTLRYSMTYYDDDYLFETTDIPSNPITIGNGYLCRDNCNAIESQINNNSTYIQTENQININLIILAMIGGLISAIATYFILGFKF